MIKQSLKQKYELSSKFFENAINENRLFHSFLFTGQNPFAQYAFALEIARILNCQNGGDENCECQNCRWIRNNSHPAVMTFSPVGWFYKRNDFFCFLSLLYFFTAKKQWIFRHI